MSARVSASAKVRVRVMVECGGRDAEWHTDRVLCVRVRPLAQSIFRQGSSRVGQSARVLTQLTFIRGDQLRRAAQIVQATDLVLRLRIAF